MAQQKKKKGKGKKKEERNAPAPAPSAPTPAPEETAEDKDGFKPPRTTEEHARARRSMWTAVCASVGVWLVAWLWIFTQIDVTWVR